MRGQSPLVRSARRIGLQQRGGGLPYTCHRCRFIRISASPATESPSAEGNAFGAPVEVSRDPADARFEVIGSPYSLLSVTLSASQRLYTRRGTVVSVAGKVENAQSTLSMLSPLSRAFLGVPFLYQRISSTTPINALIASKSPSATFSVLRLDGTTDWMVSQRNALLAWTGHTLSLHPRIQRGLSVAHWGSTLLTGRGLAALTGPGQIYEVALGEGEELVLHPSHVVAYAVNRNPPQPFRMRSTSLRLQIPSVPASVGSAVERIVPAGAVRFWRAMRDTETYKLVARVLFGLRTAARRSIWGDRLFLQFRGPTKILMSTRGVRVRDALTRDDVNEIADTEAGVVPAAVELATSPKKPVVQQDTGDHAVAFHVATVGEDGKVSFEDTKDLKDFVR